MSSEPRPQPPSPDNLERRLRRLPAPPVPTGLEAKLLAQAPSAGAAARPAKRRRWPIAAAGLAAAAVVVFVSVTAWSVWRHQPTSSPHAGTPLTVAELQQRSEREAMAGKLAVAARILSEQPGGEEPAREALAYVASRYPETAAPPHRTLTL